MKNKSVFVERPCVVLSMKRKLSLVAWMFIVFSPFGLAAVEAAEDCWSDNTTGSAVVDGTFVVCLDTVGKNLNEVAETMHLRF